MYIRSQLRTRDPALSVLPTSLTFVAGGETLSLSITSNTNWTATSDADWLTLGAASGSGNGSVNVEATANPTIVRTATITITDGAGLTEMVSVSQDDPSATLTVLPTSLTFVAGGATLPLSITSNTAWTATKDADWLTLSALSGTGPGNESIDVVASENTTTSERTATITIAYGTSSTRMVSVSQAAMPMISFGFPSGTATDDATSTSAPLEVSLEVSNGGFVNATNITITVAATTGTIADGDYTLSSSDGTLSDTGSPYTLSVPANQSTITLEFTAEDDDSEGEVATLTLSSSTATDIGTQDVHTITITDNDVPTMTVAPMISFVSASGTATDGATSTSAPLEVSLEVSNGGFVNATNIMITVAATTGTIANGDYTLAVKSGSVATLTSANPYTLSVPALTTSITLEFTSEDADNEGEVATLTLSSADAVIGTEDVHTITITDNDVPAGASTDVFNVPSEDGTLRVYPHPASDVINMKGLSSTRRYVYSLYSLTGVEVLSGLLKADTIDISTPRRGTICTCTALRKRRTPTYSATDSKIVGERRHRLCKVYTLPLG